MARKLKEQPLTGSLSISSAPVTVLVTVGIIILIDTGAMAITSDPLVIISNVFVPADFGMNIIEGHGVNVLMNYIRGPPSVQLSFGSDVLRVGINYFISPGTGTLGIEGHPVTVPSVAEDHVVKPGMMLAERLALIEQAMGG